MSDKKISELTEATTISLTDVSVLVSNGADYKFAFSTLLQFLGENLPVGANISFGTTLPQNTSGKNDDLFINTVTGAFAQKLSGTWSVVYTLPSDSNQTDGTVLYGLGVPGSSTGNNNDTYINTGTGIFYKKAAGAWSQAFSMQSGPQGPRGTAGVDGTDGNNGFSVLSGSANPSNLATGVNGDFYINTTNYTLFGPKTDGVWGTGTSLIGPDGHGIPDGGTTGQVLKKTSNDDFDTEWSTIDVSFTSLSGLPSDNAALSDALDTKVDKTTGYGLSQEDYTTSEKSKLATLSEHFKGNYTTFSALTTTNPTGNLGDYGYVDPGTGHDAKMYIWDGDDNTWVLSSGSPIPDATETISGIVELATIAEALARTDDARAMTALKTIGLILDEKKNVDRGMNPYGLNEVSLLMKNSGNVVSSTIVGASNLKLKISHTGTYPTGTQTYPFAYTAGDQVFVTFNYTDLTNASCNFILTCRDN